MQHKKLSNQSYILGIAIGAGIGVAVLALIIIMAVVIVAKKKRSSSDRVSSPVETSGLKKSNKASKSSNYTELSIKQPSNYTQLNFTEALKPNTNSGDYETVCSAPPRSEPYETVLSVNVSDSDHVYSKINNYINLSDL